MKQHERDRAWAEWAMRMIAADFRRSADTHLLPLHLPCFPGIRLYLKDESTHVTGSLKHRLARALFLYALANGNLREGTLVVEASSGSTAISEAYFARMLRLPFVAVMPATTSKEKVSVIESFGARCHLVADPTTVYEVAAQIAREARGHFMDQFTFAERATDWRGNNNIAETIFQQMSEEEHPIPRWLVVGAGTGGTATTLGRYIRYQNHATELCVVDPEHSVTFDYYRTGDATLTLERGSRVEGIGRPRVEPSLTRSVIHRMIKVPDAASYAAMFFLARRIGKRTGPSTGTNLWAAFELMSEMARAGEQGSIVTLICDTGDRYLQTYYNDVWMARQKLELRPFRRQLKAFAETGAWESVVTNAWLDDAQSDQSAP